MPLNLRRGLASELAAITPAAGEPIYLTDRNRLAIGDGATLGGLMLPGPVVPAGLKGDLVSDDRAAIQAALTAVASTGGTVYLPETAAGYLISAPLTFYSGVHLAGLSGRPKIMLKAGARFRFATLTALNNISISKLEIDGNETNLTGADDPTIVINGGSSDIDIEDCIFISLSGTTVGAIVLSGAATDCNVSRNRFYATRNVAIGLSSAFSCKVNDNLIDGSSFFDSFGIRLGEGAYLNTIANNKVNDSGLEGVGLTQSCYENHIIGNHVKNSGDNGISVSGFRNVVSGNICRYNFRAGVGVWGSLNTILGNICLSNNQEDTAYWAGIWVSLGFGGCGQNNAITGNFCDDDQVTPTQAGGVRCHSGPASDSYTLWTAGAAVTAGDYFYYGLNIYQASNSATTGATPPTHSSGSVSDGAVTWAYISSFIGAAFSQGNIVSRSNVVVRSKSAAAAFHDALSWKRNTYGLIDVLVAAGTLSGTSFTVDASTIIKKYERFEILLNGFSHSGGATANIRVELSGDNGSTWSGATTVSATIDAATLVGLHLLIDGTAAATGVRLTTTISGTGNTNVHNNVFGNTINTGPINAIRISNSQGYSMDAGTYTVLGIGPIQ